MKKTIGEKIKEIRMQNNLTMDELAEELGYSSRSTINKIEKGINDTKSSLDGLNLRAENLEAKLSGKSISVLSRAEYNAIAHDPETIYFITD